MLPPTQRGTAGAFGIALPVPRARRAGPSPSATATPPPAYRQDSLGHRFGTLREPALPVLVDKEKGAIMGRGPWQATSRLIQDTPPPPPQRSKGALMQTSFACVSESGRRALMFLPSARNSASTGLQPAPTS